MALQSKIQMAEKAQAFVKTRSREDEDQRSSQCDEVDSCRTMTGYEDV